ncbi:MAG: hypothetical protein IPN11_16155 [Opitutaceae bacterium]|nr:hypothetical protein [Opitutaceae bacterium]
MEKPTKKELMQQIVACVGPNEAIRLVSDAYSAEVLATRIGRIEEGSHNFIKQARAPLDLMQMALERVHSICELAKP